MAKTPAVQAASSAPVESKNPGLDNDPDMPDFSKWSQRQISFAPYWSPSPGNSFFGRAIGIDMRQPDFVRVQFVALQDGLVCHRGPVDGAEVVIVNKGDTFSCSTYFQVADELLFQLESGVSPATKITAKKKVPTKTIGRSAWEFEVIVAPEDDAKLRMLQPAWQKKRNELKTAEGVRPQLET